MKRHGAVLLLTLLLIAVATGGIALMLSQSDRLLRLAQHGRSDAQCAKTYADLKRLLPGTLARIGTARDLAYATMIPLSSRSSDGRFTLNAALRSDAGAFNINKVCDPAGHVNEPAANLLRTIAARYGVASPQTLCDIVCDALDADTAERQPGTETALNDPDAGSGPIDGFVRFGKLAARYIALTKDRQVLTVPWERLIGFAGEKIDINEAPSELIALIQPQIDAPTLRRITLLKPAPFESKEQLLAAAPQLASVYDSWFFVYTPGTPYPLVGDVAMRLDGLPARLRFRLDMTDRTPGRPEML